MKLDIEAANAAKAELIHQHGPRLEAVTIVLGDKGFRLEAELKAGVTAPAVGELPIPVRFFAKR